MAKNANHENERQVWTQHFGRLVGKTVQAVTFDDESMPPKTIFGLQFTDGTMAWVMSDTEGNGPGFLEIEKGRTDG